MNKWLIIFCCIAACTGCDKKNYPEAEAKQKITVTYTNQPQSTLIHIAMAKGYFAEEGLDVQPLLRTFGKDALKTVLDHQSDFATVAETPVMFSILKGEKIYVIANIEASNTNNGLVVRKDAGIATPAGLKGKRIGYTPGTTSEFFMDSLLTANGLLRKDVRTVALKPDEMPDAIMANKVDALSTWNYPLTLIKHKLGANGLIFYDREIYTETFNIAAQQDFVRKNPEAVKRFLRALIKAEVFVKGNADEAQTIMSADTKVDKKLIQEVWGEFNYRVLQNHTLLLTLEDETRWAMKQQLVPQGEMPDFLQYIYLDGLKAVKLEAVQMNR